MVTTIPPIGITIRAIETTIMGTTAIMGTTTTMGSTTIEMVDMSTVHPTTISHLNEPIQFKDFVGGSSSAKR